MSEYTKRIETASDYLLARAGIAPRVGVVLGSGWGGLLKGVANPVEIPYKDVPGMPVSSVPGHAGKWVFGQIGDQRCAIMSGRVHYYEGYPLRDVTLPIRIMKQMGVQILLLTNAAGAVNKGYKPGDIMIITDHLNLSGNNPLIGPNDDWLGPRFPDMSEAYDKALVALARDMAEGSELSVHEGVYAWMSGPSFETPAEIRMVRTLGGDAVGMSTVPEILVGVHSGMEVLGLSCLSNMAAGILDQPLNHQEVVEIGKRVQKSFTGLLLEILGRM